MLVKDTLALKPLVLPGLHTIHVIKQKAFIHLALAELNTKHGELVDKNRLLYYEWHHPGEQKTNALKAELADGV